MTRAILILIIAASVIYAAGSFVPAGQIITGSGAALAFGFLLLAALQVGEIAETIRLPHVSGYLFCGLLFGPEVIGLVTSRMIEDLSLVKGTAVGLIALLAGSQLNFRRHRPRLRAITLVSLSCIACAALLLFPLFYWITSRLPVTASMTPIERAAVALVCANVLACFSSAVVISVLSETRASGPLAELVMPAVVVADLTIVTTFALTTSLARVFFPAASTGAGLQRLLAQIFGSIAVGILFGILLAIYIRRVRSGAGLFIFALLFVAAEAGRVLHLDPLLVGLATGLFVENISKASGEEVVASTAPVTLPVFAIFFAVIGAEIHLHAFLHVAPFALAAAAVRAAGIFAGSRIGTRLGRVEKRIVPLVPLGLLPQAGVAIALAVLVLNDFPPWGRVVGTVLLGSIVVNELAGPVLFRFALARAGEIASEEPANSRGAIRTPHPT
jgi:Kef-type K+ transport system membrane component KefB